MELGGIPFHPNVADPSSCTRFYVAKTHEFLKGCFGISVGDNGSGSQSGSVSQSHSLGTIGLQVDAGDSRPGSNFYATGGCSRCECSTNNPHASFDLSWPMKAIDLTQAAVDVPKHGIGGARTHVGTHDTFERQHRLKQFVVKSLLHDVVHVDQSQAK